jgi:ribosomal protein S27E
MPASKVYVDCPACGKRFNKSGLPGHMRFKHKTDTKGQRTLEDRSPAGILSEDSLTCPSCRSQDMDAVSLSGETVKADNLLRDTRPVKTKLGTGTLGGKPVNLVATLAEHAPAGKKFLELKCRKCGARKIVTFTVA